MKNIKDDINKKELNDNTNEKLWRVTYNPIRELRLWGWDKDGNPGFITFYGTQKFKSSNYSEIDSYDYSEKSKFRAILEDEVTYSDYVINTGKCGHMPSELPFKIARFNVEEDDQSDKLNFLNKHKRTRYSRDNWNGNRNLQSFEKITLNYYDEKSYRELAIEVINYNLELDGFKIAIEPNEILGFKGEELELIIQLMSNSNLYMRKKYLRELLTKNLEKDFYQFILNKGSEELISGLFLELTKLKNNVILEEGKKLINEEITWAKEEYRDGIKRCIKIYIDSLNEDFLKKERIKLKKNIDGINLRLIFDGNKSIPEDKELTGRDYKRLSYNGAYWIRDSIYNHVTRERESVEPIKIFKESYYNDGFKLNFNKVKDTLQRAESFGFEEVVGEIAYYVDTPAMYYYSSAKNLMKELQYLRRYLRRVLSNYLENDSKKFMESMKIFLTKYKNCDDIDIYYWNFQDNYLLHYFMVDNWEVAKELWKNNLGYVIEIAKNATIEKVLEKCREVILNEDEVNFYLATLPYQELIELTSIHDYEIRMFFMRKLKEVIEGNDSFKTDLFFSLIESENEEINKLGIDYRKKYKGSIEVEKISNFLFLNNKENWKDIIEEEINKLSIEEYIVFIKSMLLKGEDFSKKKISISQEMKDVLFMGTNKIMELEEEQRVKFTEELINALVKIKRTAIWINEFIEEVIFTNSYEELALLGEKITINKINVKLSERNKRTIDLIKAVKEDRVPEDGEILYILENSSSKMIKLLVQLISKNKSTLKNRNTTLLILLESKVYAMNELGKEIFGDIEDSLEAHKIILDSPVPKVYLFALKKLDEIYEDKIPDILIERLLEHPAVDVKKYISDKTESILNNFNESNKEIFIYYAKTILLLPNKIRYAKTEVYKVIPQFVKIHKDKLNEIDEILLEVGSSNIIKDSEEALVTLAKLREGNY